MIPPLSPARGFDRHRCRVSPSRAERGAPIPPGRSISRLLTLLPSNRIILSTSPSVPSPVLSRQSSFLARRRLAASQARVVRGVRGFIPLPATLCWMGGWARARKSGAKKKEGGGEERLQGGGRIFCNFWGGGIVSTCEFGLFEK